MIKLDKVRDGIERWYAKQGLPDVNVHVEYDGNGTWQFWRVDDDGNSESGTSYRDRQGRIEFYGSLEPDVHKDDDL